MFPFCQYFSLMIFSTLLTHVFAGLSTLLTHVFSTLSTLFNLNFADTVYLRFCQFVDVIYSCLCQFVDILLLMFLSVFQLSFLLVSLSVCCHVFGQFAVIDFSCLCRFVSTVECCYNMVRYDMLLHTVLQLLKHNTNPRLNSLKTPHISPSRASYGRLLWGCWRKSTVVMAPHCIVYSLESEHKVLIRTPGTNHNRILIEIHLLSGKYIWKIHFHSVSHFLKAL